MKPLLCCLAALAFTASAAAQTANPIVSSAKEMYDRQSKFIIAAFEQMPAEKYSYSPTPEQMSFAKMAIHMVGANTAVCGMLSSTPGQAPKLSETDSKDALVAAVKASFEGCDKAFAGLKDSQLGDEITFFRGAKAPRARALFEEVGDLEDHYSQMAGYMRLNGLTPPSAVKH